MIVENLPVPFDRRVWSQARTLKRAGYDVSVICPKGKGAERAYEVLEGIHIFRHPLPIEAKGVLAYPLEYFSALVFELWLAFRVFFSRGFDVIHACNPPDTIFLIGGLFKFLAGTRFVFDHHDINPELYEAKFGRRDIFWKLLVWLERLTFKTADVSIATNGSYRRIAIDRGGMAPDSVFVVRSGPDLKRMEILPPRPELKKTRAHLVGYVGVIGQQEGIDLLLHAVRSVVSDHGRHDIHFGIVGGGPALKDMEALAVRLDVADYVTFTGRVSDRALLEMLNTADVCVNPDRGERHERQVDHEQDHGVYGFGETHRAVRAVRGPVCPPARRRSMRVRTIRRTWRRRLSRSSTIRRSVRPWAPMVAPVCSRGCPGSTRRRNCWRRMTRRSTPRKQVASPQPRHAE